MKSADNFIRHSEISVIKKRMRSIGTKHARNLCYAYIMSSLILQWILSRKCGNYRKKHKEENISCLKICHLERILNPCYNFGQYDI